MSDEEFLRLEGADEGAVCAVGTPSTIPSAGNGPPPPVGEELPGSEGEEGCRRYAPYTRFTAEVARTVCTRIAAGERIKDVCADADMPSMPTLRRWARKRGVFGRALARAKAFGGRKHGRATTYDAAVAHEITARLSEGETLTSIGADPAMPCTHTIFVWRKLHREFGDAVRLAREVVGERFSDLGWKLAMEATPETAYLTHVRLSQLRWTAGLMAPASHGKLKPVEPDVPRPEQTVLLRHFQLEVHPETGQHRVVGFCPHPGTMQPVRDSQGEWSDPPDVIRARHAKYVGSICTEPPSIPVDPEDPEGWC